MALAADAALRVASLNLCTDELLLLLAAPRQIVSVSHLSHAPEESPLWRTARAFPFNNGRLESAVVHKPQLILTMGSVGGARAALARRFGARLVELPYPDSPGEVVEQAEQVARLLGRPSAALSFRRQLAQLNATRPPISDGAFLASGGLSLAPQGLGASWLSLAGFRQPALASNRLSLELLATSPPNWLIRSDYRFEQASRGAAWLRHPVVSRLESRTLSTDGRAWTCGGLPMLDEITRLRSRKANR
nr:hypothetical protein [uncultured Sphingomonas sp.]